MDKEALIKWLHANGHKQFSSLVVRTDKNTFRPLVDLIMEAQQQVNSVDLADVVKSLFEPIDELPENRPLYKDSGLWQIRTDDMEKVLYQQEVNESFDDFIKRCHSKESIWTNADV